MDISITATGHATSDARYSFKSTFSAHPGGPDHAARSTALAAPAEYDTVTLSAQAIARLEMKIDASQERLDAPSGDTAETADVARAGLVMELQSLNNALAKALKDRTSG